MSSLCWLFCCHCGGDGGTELLSLSGPICLLLLYLTVLFRSNLPKICAQTNVLKFPPFLHLPFTSISFIVSVLPLKSLKSLIHFKSLKTLIRFSVVVFVVVKLVRDRGLVLFCKWMSSFPRTIYWRSCPPLNVCSWCLCQIPVAFKYLNLFLGFPFYSFGFGFMPVLCSSGCYHHIVYRLVGR